MDFLLTIMLLTLFMISLVAKRSILGPQKIFARTSLSLGISGLIIFCLSAQKDDLFMFVGPILMMSGMLLALIMYITESFYFLSKKLLQKKY